MSAVVVLIILRWSSRGVGLVEDMREEERKKEDVVCRSLPHPPPAETPNKFTTAWLLSGRFLSILPTSYKILRDCQSLKVSTRSYHLLRWSTVAGVDHVEKNQSGRCHGSYDLTKIRQKARKIVRLLLQTPHTRGEGYNHQFSSLQPPRCCPFPGPFLILSI